MRRLMLVVAAALVAGCFSPTYKEGLKCSAKNTCPPGFGCNAGICERNFQPDAGSDGAAREGGAETSSEAPLSDGAAGDGDAQVDLASPDAGADVGDAADVGEADAASDTADVGGDAADASGDGTGDVAEGGAIDAPAEKPDAAIEAGSDAVVEAGSDAVGPPPGGLIGRWALGDEHTNGETVPDLATADGAQNGTIFDNGEYMQTVKDRNAVANKAISITADDFVSDQYAYIKVPGITSLPASVTISAWIAFTVGNQLGLIAGINHGPQLYMDEYKITVRMPLDSFNYGKAQGPTLTSNQWVHVAGVVSPSGPTNWKLDLYVNGALSMSTTIANNGVAPAGNFNIGGMYNCSGQGCNDGFKGFIDDVRLYNHALTPAEVMAVYAAPTN